MTATYHTYVSTQDVDGILHKATTASANNVDAKKKEVVGRILGRLAAHTAGDGDNFVCLHPSCRSTAVNTYSRARPSQHNCLTLVVPALQEMLTTHVPS